MKQQPTFASSSAARISPLLPMVVNMLMELSGYTLVNSLPSPSTILICRLLLKRMCFQLSSMKRIELMGQLQEQRTESTFLSKRTSYSERFEPSPAANSKPEGSERRDVTGADVFRVHTLFLYLQSQASMPSPPQKRTLRGWSWCRLLMAELVWYGVRNLPSSRDILYTSSLEADTHRLALDGLYSRSRGQWGILVLQWAPYWAWKSMLRSVWAITILLQSSDRILNLTTSQSSPLRHFRDSSAVSQILTWGPQMPAATMKRWSGLTSTWVVATLNWKSWMSSIRRLKSLSQRRDLLCLAAVSMNSEQLLPADMLQVLTPLISVTLYINNLYNKLRVRHTLINHNIPRKS